MVLITHGNGRFAARKCPQFSVTLTARVPNMLAGLSKVSLSPWFSEPKKNLLTPISKVRRKTCRTTKNFKLIATNVKE